MLAPPEHIVGHPRAEAAYATGTAVIKEMQDARFGGEVPDSREALVHQGNVFDIFHSILADAPGPPATTGEGLLGVVRIPMFPVSSVVSIDLCDLLRLTGEGYADLFEETDIRTANQDPERGYAMREEEKAPGVQEALEILLIGAMDGDLIEPVPEHKEIQRILVELGDAQGAYRLVNTSTLPLCEEPTARLLQEFYPDCFDGIVLPRNHDGDHDKMTKGESIELVIEAMMPEEIGDGIQTIAKGDDAVHHILDAASSADRMGLEFIGRIPEWPWNNPQQLDPSMRERIEADSRIEIVETPSQVFQSIQERLTA